MHSQTILITAPKIHPDALALLADYRVIQTDASITEDALCELCAAEKPVAILARYGLFNERVLKASPLLKIVARHGVGMDTIDQVAAARLGIDVKAAIGSNSQAVAELAIGMMLSCARLIPAIDHRMHQGHWDKDAYQGIELHGKILGVVGCGSIGSRVVRIAQAIGMNVIVCDPYLSSEDLPQGTTRVSLDELLAQAHVVSLHCPLDDSTRNMLDASKLAQLRPDAIVVNTARAGLFDEAAMQSLLQKGQARLGLDCFVHEPLATDSPWLTTPNTVLTPHIGGTTDGGMRGMGVGAAQHILDHLNATAAVP